MTEPVIVAIIGVLGTLLGTVLGMLSTKLSDNRHAKNDNKLYISKAQYDLEFDVYRQLSKKTFALIVDLTTIYTNHHFREDTENTSPAENLRKFTGITNDICDVQDVLHENAPFIPENIYNEFNELYELAKEQFWIYLEDSKVCIRTGQPLPITEESVRRVEKIEVIYKSLIQDLRKYLFSLCIVP